MRCGNCGGEVADGTIFCPHCGHRLKSRADVVPTGPCLPYQDTYKAYESPEPERRRVSGCRWALLTGAFTLVFLVIILGIGALAVYHGLQDQSRENLQVAQEHYNKGLNHMAKGSYELAIAEYEEALRLNPDLSEAQLKLDEARSLAVAKPAPTTDADRDLADRLYREARAFYDQHEWEKAIADLEELRSLDAIYHPQDLETLLFGAYYYGGLALVNEGRMEEAIHRFDRALELQPDNPDVVGQRHLASLYIAGLGYWEADWAKAVEQFDALYQIEPSYRDVGQRLHEAHVRYGDLLFEKQAWCEAQEQYEAALKVIPTQEIAQRRDKAAKVCAAPAGATSEPPNTPGETPAAQGTFVGEFAGYEDISHITTRWVRVRGRVINAAGEGVPGKTVKIAAFDWSGTATTGATGEYGFDFLDKDLEFTLSLVDLPSTPIKVKTKFGVLAKVNFVEKP